MSCTITSIASTTRAPDSLPHGSLPASSPTADRQPSSRIRPSARNWVRSPSAATASYATTISPCRTSRSSSIRLPSTQGVMGCATSPKRSCTRWTSRGSPARHRRILSTLDPLAREQYLDFVRLRRFRQSLLVRHDAPADTRTSSQRLRGMHVSATFELVRAAAAGGIHKLARKLDPAAGGGGPVRKLLDELVARQPATLEIASLHSRFDLGSLSRPHRGRPEGCGLRGHRRAARAAGRADDRAARATRRQPARSAAGAYERPRDDALARARQHRGCECLEAVAARRRDARSCGARRCRPETGDQYRTVARGGLRRLRAQEVRATGAPDGSRLGGLRATTNPGTVTGAGVRQGFALEGRAGTYFRGRFRCAPRGAWQFQAIT